jgi:hypothetical protein
VKRKYRKNLRNSKKRIQYRLRDRGWTEQANPMFTASNIHYQIAQRGRGVSCGGLGAIHLMVKKLGLVKELDESVRLLKRHLPYHESDHVLNIAYNALLGGVRLEDIELRRNDEVFLNAIGAQRIPDPTTSGDFTRRFDASAITELMEGINRVRQRVWGKQKSGFMQEAFLDVDGTQSPTRGKCKGGMGINYKGVWGYAPLIVSLANTKEVLYLVNRPGNVTSHEGCVEWIDRAIGLVRGHAERVCLRGDTDYSLTENFDRWDAGETQFIFGMNAHAKVVKLAEELGPEAWSELERVPRYEIATEPRRKAPRVKEAIVRQKGFKNQVLKGESVAEFDYRPIKCKGTYRMVVVRKNISVQKGEAVLFDEMRYFFYITNRRDLAKEQVVGLANQRCDQENVIEQLKNGVNAMRMPVEDLLSNWSYMVMTALAWNLKAWYGLLMPNRQRGLQIVTMEFRRFLHAIILLPAQIIRTGRRIVYRLLSWNEWMGDFFRTWERLRCLSPG